MKLKISEIREIVQEVISEKLEQKPERKTRSMNPYQASQANQCRQCGDVLQQRQRLRRSTDRDGFDEIVPQGKYWACDGYLNGDCDYYVSGDKTSEVNYDKPYPAERNAPLANPKGSMIRGRLPPKQ